MTTTILSSLSDVFDIAIILFLLYVIYRVFRGTKILRIIFLFIGLVVLKKIAIETHLTLTSKVFGFIIDNSVLLFIIVFQDEIRKFIHRSSRALFNLNNNQNFSTSSETVANACEYMAQRKTGALIIFERSMPLDGIATKGILLNADVSRELILSIFEKKSILHDGALIISKDRIISASSFVPLTRNDNVDIKYGTRHRSALGVTEEADCIAIVVSEERGEIKIAENGILSPSLKKDELKIKLDSLLKANHAESNKMGQIADSLSLWVKKLFRQK